MSVVRLNRPYPPASHPYGSSYRWGTDAKQLQARKDKTSAKYLPAPEPQAYIDISADNRKGLRSFFAFGKRAVEQDAYQQAHLSVSGLPGVVRLAVLDTDNTPIPFAPFEWGGRKYHTDASGSFILVEKQFFQNSISVENERSKFVTQMISLVVGQPATNVIALFGFDFYEALGGDTDGKIKAIELYKIYLRHAGIQADIISRKSRLFEKYADAEASPEIMCNYGDNDPEWSRAFNKLCMLIEYHPSAILFDEGHLDPTDASGRVGGDLGRNNVGTLPNASKEVEKGIDKIITSKQPGGDGQTIY